MLLRNMATGPKVDRDRETLNQLDEVHPIEPVDIMLRTDNLMLKLVSYLDIYFRTR